MATLEQRGGRVLAFNADSLAGIGRREQVVPSPADQSPVTQDVMVERIRAKIGGGSILEAFKAVDRALFVPEDARAWAYAETGIALKMDSSGDALSVMSRPTMVARMIEALDLTGDEDVLEVGAGSGYGAAVLSRLSRRVDTVEIDPELAEVAEANLRNLGFDNVAVHIEDGTQGLPERAPFGAILVTGGVEEIPQALIDQLVVGGRIVAPVGLEGSQFLEVGIKQADGTLTIRDTGSVVFIPLDESIPSSLTI